jgi:hypothetical protein
MARRTAEGKLVRAAFAGASLLAAIAGCGGPKAPAPADTGSREAVRAFYEAVIRQEWQPAYAALHPDTRRRFTPEQFNQRAKTYRKKLGFEPEALHIRSCEEHGEEAVAHVVLVGKPGGHRRRYTDGAVLRRHAGSWRVVLPANFGR